MEDFRHNDVNITGFRLVASKEPHVRDILKQMDIYERRTGNKLFNHTNVIKVTLYNKQQYQDNSI